MEAPSRAQAGFNVAQAFAIRHLRERHGAELFSATQAPHANVSPYFTTMRSKLVHGTKYMTCANSVRPAFTAMPPIGKIEEITAKPSSQVQIDTKQYPTVFHNLARSASGAGARKAHLRQYPFAIAAGPERTASACFRRP